MFEFYANVPITDNIKKLIKIWNKTSDMLIRVYDIEKAKNDYRFISYINDLGFTYVNAFGEIEMYVSDIYPEATIIHEILHHILRVEGYCTTKVNLSDIFFYPKYILDTAKEFADAITNHMDHLIIDVRIKDYNLDFKRMCNLEYLRMNNDLEKFKNVELNEIEWLINSLLFAIRSFDCYSFYEPNRKRIFNLLKEVNQQGYKYSKKLYDDVVQNGFLSKEAFKESSLLVINKLNKILHKKININKNNPLYDIFKLIKIT